MVNLIYLDFGHKKFTKKARSYRHEVSHVTSDMLKMDQKANHCLFLCEGIVKVIGSKERPFRIEHFNSEARYFNDLLFELENFTFRLHAYRDKLCIFLNYIMRIGYDESDTDLLNKLLRHEVIKKYHIDTELKKFKNKELQTVLNTRKNMSHKIYYDGHNPLFMPSESPRDIGLYKATLLWKNKLRVEVKKIDGCMEKVFEINERVSEKLIKFLDQH